MVGIMKSILVNFNVLTQQAKGKLQGQNSNLKQIIQGEYKVFL